VRELDLLPRIPLFFSGLIASGRCSYIFSVIAWSFCDDFSSCETVSDFTFFRVNASQAKRLCVRAHAFAASLQDHETDRPLLTDRRATR
jgi:hypothetical protein